jgi:flagellar basal body-associated protein FliL
MKKLGNLATLMVVLAVCFLVAGAALLATGVSKAGKSDCKDEQGTGIAMTLIGVILVALCAAISTFVYVANKDSKPYEGPTTADYEGRSSAEPPAEPYAGPSIEDYNRPQPPPPGT